MKRIFSITIAYVAFSLNVSAQCTIDPNLTTPGLYPPPDSLTPITRNQAYIDDVQFRTPGSIDTLGFTVAITSIQITSITGQPSGINYTCNPSNCTIAGGATGCVQLTGNTSDPVGQYPLVIIVTAVTTLGTFPNIDVSTLGISYYLTVIEQAGVLSVSVSAAPTSICAGASSTLTATVNNGTGSETFAWSGGAGTANPATVNPTGNTTYTVTVTDGANTATGSATVTVNSAPAVGFTVSGSSPAFTFTNTSTGNPTPAYSWDFDDGSAAVTTTNASHTYTANGTYTVTLTATNICGSFASTEDVTVTGVFISPVKNNLEFNVYPNPSSGIFTVTLNNASNPVSLRIFDLNGKAVYEESLTENGTIRKQLELTSLPKGVYTLHLNSEEGNGIQRLTVY